MDIIRIQSGSLKALICLQRDFTVFWILTERSIC